MSSCSNESDKKYVVKRFNTDDTYTGIKKFDCGDSMLSAYASNLRRECVRDNINVLVLLEENNFCGFVTAKPAQLGRDQIPEGTFPYGLPPVFTVMKIPMLAIELKNQGKGWGTELLRAVLDFILNIAEQMSGLKGVFLDAKAEAREFYESLDFQVINDGVPDENGTIPMFISMDCLRESKRAVETKTISQ